jgi:peptide/nickel transport system substrate-binding protein
VALVATGALAFFAATQCSPARSAPERPSHLVVGVPEGDLSTADVGIQQIARILSYEGLNYKGPDGHPEPRLAESWTSSEDGLKWTFQIRRGVQFHDGTPVNATRIAQSLNTLLQQPNVTALRPGFLDVTGIVAEDDATLTINLSRPSSFLLDDLDVHLGSQGPPGEKSAGTGLYRIVSANGTETTLDVNERYYLGAPEIKRITLRAYPTLRTAWAALMRGEIEMVSDVAHDAVEFVSNDTVGTYSFLRNYLYLIAFNSEKPQFRNPTVRRALNAGVDRDELLKTVLKGHGMAAHGPFWPRHWAFDSSVTGYVYDPSLAASTLRELRPGSKAPSEGQFASGIRFKCLIPTDFAILERLALTVQKQLYDLGVDMQIEAVPVDKYNVRIRNGNFDAVLIDMISGPTFARPYQFWRSPGELKGLNGFGYRNLEADKWFDALRHAPDDATVRAAASQLQRVLREDPPAIFLAWNERTRAVSRRFRVPTEGARDPLYTLRLWSLDPTYATTH